MTDLERRAALHPDGDSIDIEFDHDWLTVKFTFVAGCLDIERIEFADGAYGRDIASMMDLCAAYGPRLWDQIEQRVMDAIKEDAIRAQYDWQISNIKEITP